MSLRRVMVMLVVFTFFLQACAHPTPTPTPVWVYRDALIVGRLVLQDGCLRLQAGRESGQAVDCIENWGLRIITWP